ncbi:MAG: VTT domain-containing protein [Gammaproteobacteria bacterium]|nr:VTT domain-containing protein [Gammaproteobacteria bacterium]MDH5736472.1 VTT domain-containing protein [Gammaproteobacteria bacterium]
MKNNILKIILILALVAGIAVVITYRDQLNADALQQWLTDAGAAAPLLFMLVYAIGTIFFLPGSLLTLVGGALFGPVLGTFYNLTAATIGAMLSFLVARYLASDWVANKTGGRMKQLITGVENEGWRFVAFVRLVPLFPFNLLNYALGLTRISFNQYSIATYICMLPGAIAYTYLGYIGREAATGGEGLIQKSLLALALLAIVSFLPRIIGSMRKGAMVSIPELKQRLDAGEDLLLLDVRTPEDYNGEQKHVAGSVLIPVEQLAERINEINDYLEKPIITICRTDRKSAKAAQILAQHGFADVHVARMGMTDWIKNQYPTE